MSKMEYYFKIGRDFGNDKEFSMEVNSIEEAILIENIVTTIANDPLIDVDASIGGIKMEEDGEWVEFMDENFDDFNSIKYEKEYLMDKIFADHIKVEKIVRKFVKEYLDIGLNWRFFKKMVNNKLKPIQL